MNIDRSLKEFLKKDNDGAEIFSGIDLYSPHEINSKHPSGPVHSTCKITAGRTKEVLPSIPGPICLYMGAYNGHSIRV